MPKIETNPESIRAIADELEDILKGMDLLYLPVLRECAAAWERERDEAGYDPEEEDEEEARFLDWWANQETDRFGAPNHCRVVGGRVVGIDSARDLYRSITEHIKEVSDE